MGLVSEVLEVIKSFNRELTATLSVRLGGSYCCKNKAVRTEILGRCQKVTPRINEGRVDIRVSHSPTPHSADSPAIFHHTRTEGEHGLVTTIIGHTLHEAPPFSHVRGFGDDVEGPPNGINSKLRGSQTSLHLHGIDRVTQTGPIRPIYPTAFHVVDGNSVDENRDISLVKAADVDSTIPKSTPAFGGVDARRNVEGFHQFFVPKLLLNRFRIQCGDRNRRLPVDGHRRDHIGL